MSHDNTHDPFSDRSVPKRIQKIQFGALNPRDIAQLSVVEVSHHELYKRPQRIPRKFGPMDPLLGVPDKTSLCGSCGRDINKCPGHFGHIQLVLPVFHIGFIKHIASILNCVCKQCSKLLLSSDDKAKILTAQRSSKCDQNMRIMLLKRVVEICKKTQTCPSCGELNFLVKKVRGQLRLVHDRNVKSKAASANFVSLCADAIKETPEMESMLDKLAEEMDPLRSLTLFRNISNEDCEVSTARARSRDVA
jgi:DNA-directed RNA polymerase III subunit RPC1